MRVSFKHICIILVGLMIIPTQAYAYMGPGAGISAFGAVASVVSVVLLAIVGFVWYPAKRLIRVIKRRSSPEK